jgi:hypothetical protein
LRGKNTVSLAPVNVSSSRNVRTGITTNFRGAIWSIALEIGTRLEDRVGGTFYEDCVFPVQ